MKATIELERTSTAPLDERSRALRHMVIDALEGGGRGHIGPTLSLLEILRVLFDDVLRLRPDEPKWRERDRLILSKGHGCLALYVMLADKGFISADALRRQCKSGALLGGHPEAHIPGVEFSTGALGHGLPVGTGLALAARLDERDSRVFVVMGDGELQEGSVWEALMFGYKHGLDNLIAIVDHNKMQSYASLAEILPIEPIAPKFASFGWSVAEVDGHDVAALRGTLNRVPFEPGKPSMIVAHTLKGRGIEEAEQNPHWHHKTSIKPEDAQAMRAALEHAR